MAIWKLNELRDLIKKQLPSNRQKRAIALIKSIEWKLIAASYHVITAKEAMEQFCENEEIDMEKALALTLTDSDESNLFNHLVTVRGINLVSAAVTMHSIPEIIIQLISLLFSEVEPDIHNIVLKKEINNISSSKLKESLEAIVNSNEYNYLIGFTNTVKHICLVEPVFQISLVGSGHNGILFQSFIYKGKEYSEKPDTELLCELDALHRMYIHAGIQINAALR